ncbi:MAG TPA: LacI family DNA-binding transcriptional regulator [Tepidisphaeraceae bacterium]|jgi:DNA-binding LacI/PurR family transcriptional regulator
MTAAKLAKTLNLSRTTVSLVLNGRAERYGLARETVDRVLSGARKLNYQPDPIARQLAGMRSNVVGLLISGAYVVDPRLLEKMEVYAAKKQLRFIICHAIGDVGRVREYLQDFRARRVDAVISIHHNRPISRGSVFEELKKLDKVVYFEKPSGQIRNSWHVDLDYFEMGRIAAQHLIDRGCRRIGLIGLDEKMYPILRRRREGYSQALREAALPHGRDLIWQIDQQRSLRWNEPPDEAEAVAIIEELVVRQKVDGIFAANDLYAARLMTALRRIGRRVPDDVAVIGADNMDISTLVEPRITTVDLAINELAEATIQLLFEMLDPTATGAQKSARGIVVKPKLVIRESA